MKVAFSGGTMVLLGQFGLFRLANAQQEDEASLTMIVVDYSKCTGCRTCETVCSAFNHPREVNGELLNGTGNPYLSNIKVHPSNPDADVPTVCTMCPDNPCIEACPVASTSLAEPLDSAAVAAEVEFSRVLVRSRLGVYAEIAPFRRRPGHARLPPDVVDRQVHFRRWWVAGDRAPISFGRRSR